MKLIAQISTYLFHFLTFSLILLSFLFFSPLPLLVFLSFSFPFLPSLDLSHVSICSALLKGLAPTPFPFQWFVWCLIHCGCLINVGGKEWVKERKAFPVWNPASLAWTLAGPIAGPFHLVNQALISSVNSNNIYFKIGSGSDPIPCLLEMPSMAQNNCLQLAVPHFWNFLAGAESLSKFWTPFPFIDPSTINAIAGLPSRAKTCTFHMPCPLQYVLLGLPAFLSFCISSPGLGKLFL